MIKVIPYSTGGHIEKVQLKSALEERYLSYALSTIMHRALPDVRDGLKPVHRRIIYAMRLLHLNPNKGYTKCARIVGDVMGKLHPHGDASIYEALVRLVQDFSARYPLIDGQGNFGNIDGDAAAAMRYTEARLTDVSMLLLEGIAENVIDFSLTYNEELKEPVVLPAAFPNLLANGASGIAVGMATSIPPHNIVEVCDAALHLISYPGASSDDLSEIIQGPDFPTAGVIVESREHIREAYRIGRGSFRLRARWYKEESSRGIYFIVVTEIPYQVQKSRLLEKTAELLLSRKLPLLDNILDESADDIRIILEPKNRTVDPDILMESLFKLTEFEVRIPLNMNVVSMGHIPNVLSLREVLQQWLFHRKEVLVRRLKNRMEVIACRLEILSGYMVTYLNLDKVISILRIEEEPKTLLFKEFRLTESQVEAILNMQMRFLRKLEEFKIQKEFDSLSSERDALEKLLLSDGEQWKVIFEEVSNLRKQFHSNLGSRRTTFEKLPVYDIQQIQESLIEKEPVTIIYSEKGWLRALKGHVTDYSTLSFKEDDRLKFAFHAMKTDKIVFVTSGGRFYTIKINMLPGGRGHGEPIRLLLDIENNQDIATVFISDPCGVVLIVSYYGYGFLVRDVDIIANTRKGKQVMNVKPFDRVYSCLRVIGDYVAITGENRKMLVFPLRDIPEMLRGRGVRLQNYSSGGVSDIRIFMQNKGLSCKTRGTKSCCFLFGELKEWIGKRGTVGRSFPKGFPHSGKFS
ncbi:MAG: topoisomerase IV subunit A [Candidatus Tokpelaia sp. JSC161]|jgi:topoisomerase-4 subunit A|nr:MAG: topoisomerase IV subunit A [Candidatus Tokpelaia sp. JSC161]